MVYKLKLIYEIQLKKVPSRDINHYMADHSVYMKSLSIEGKLINLVL